MSLSDGLSEYRGGSQRVYRYSPGPAQSAGGKKVFIRSGIRFDYMLADQSGGFLRELCEHHISGTLKVAPEHISDNVLKRMHKPDRSVFERFCRKYEAENKRIGKNNI